MENLDLSSAPYNFERLLDELELPEKSSDRFAKFELILNNWDRMSINQLERVTQLANRFFESHQANLKKYDSTLELIKAKIRFSQYEEKKKEFDEILSGSKTKEPKEFIQLFLDIYADPDCFSSEQAEMANAIEQNEKLNQMLNSYFTKLQNTLNALMHSDQLIASNREELLDEFNTTLTDSERVTLLKKLEEEATQAHEFLGKQNTSNFNFNEQLSLIQSLSRTPKSHYASTPRSSSSDRKVFTFKADSQFQGAIEDEKKQKDAASAQSKEKDQKAEEAFEKLLKEFKDFIKLTVNSSVAKETYDQYFLYYFSEVASNKLMQPAHMEEIYELLRANNKLAYYHLLPAGWYQKIVNTADLLLSERTGLTPDVPVLDAYRKSFTDLAVKKKSVRSLIERMGLILKALKVNQRYPEHYSKFYSIIERKRDELIYFVEHDLREDVIEYRGKLKELNQRLKLNPYDSSSEMFAVIDSFLSFRSLDANPNLDAIKAQDVEVLKEEYPLFAYRYHVKQLREVMAQEEPDMEQFRDVYLEIFKSPFKDPELHKELQTSPVLADFEAILDITPDEATPERYAYVDEIVRSYKPSVVKKWEESCPVVKFRSLVKELRELMSKSETDNDKFKDLLNKILETNFKDDQLTSELMNSKYQELANKIAEEFEKT